ncbi:MAG: entericidin A/B family lipoprotein [Betaproteobacteria bacterium]|nr:entericidin A/B family lipoprotein [Betaproteobacteria bacterium]
MKQRTLFYLALLVAVVSALTACNTVHGVGKDIEAGGKAVQKASH